jgi:FKBP-type peptidyl-prolyl cis-trans isomerase 2
MRPVETIALTLALCFGTAAHAATLPSQGEQHITRAEQAAVADGTKVTIAFSLMVPETQQTIPDNVSEYIPGEEEIIPALEDALMGMKPGERKRVELQPEEAFGPYDEQKMMKIRRDMLPTTARNGSIYATADGQPITVVALAEDTAIVDLNHPLAGKHLVIDVEVLRVEQPT